MKLRQTEKPRQGGGQGGGRGQACGDAQAGHRPTERGGRGRQHRPGWAQEDTGDNRERGTWRGPLAFLPANSPPPACLPGAACPYICSGPCRALLTSRPRERPAELSIRHRGHPRSLGNRAQLPQGGAPCGPSGLGCCPARDSALPSNSIPFKHTVPTTAWRSRHPKVGVPSD